ncbi:MAG: FtsK/SpoIIIE domain-containing protein [Chloroflexota bacterium]|nr:FtsK/SpoIIIE domain-containing protein [Chloroflexota bacterium]
MHTHDLRQHMILTEQAIAAAFVNDGLSIHLVGGTQGPHTLTFALRLYQPTKASLAKALKLAGAVEAAIGDSPVRIYTERGVIFVEVPSPMPVRISGHCLHGQGLAVPLGITARQAVAGVDFIDSPHLLLIGPTNAGKTTAARSIAYHLAKQNSLRLVRFIIFTFKPKDWRMISQLTYTMAVVVDPTEAQQMIAWVKTLMHQRNQAEVDTPHIFLFLDDLLNLLSCTSVATDLAEVASLGRAAGIHLLIGTQRLGEIGAGGAAVTGNIRTRLVFGTADAQDAAMFTGRGESGAEKLGRYKGDALLINEGGSIRVAVASIAEADLATLPQDPDSVRPWLRVTTPTGEKEHPTTVPRRSHPATPGHYAVTRDDDSGVFRAKNDKDAPCAGVTSRVTLPDTPPDQASRTHLQQLFAELGSQRAVLKAAWGGIVNEDGNTPKTRRWLHEALTEGST